MSDARPPVDFVVIGAQRSASTYVSACLRDHPGLFMCGDEVPYFEDPFFESSPVSALRAVFADAAPGQKLGIQRPDYLARAECPGNIRSLAPDARLLAVLRDPVARAISAYFWYVQFGLLPLVPLDVGLTRLLDGWTDPGYPRAFEILEVGHYGRHLTRYVDTFGSDQVLALLDDDLADLDIFGRVYAFLGVDPAHRPTDVSRTTNAGVHDLRRLRFLRTRRRLAWSWDSVTQYSYVPRRRRRPVASLVSAGLVAIDRTVLARLLRSPRPTLDPGLLARLRATYVDDVSALASLLARDLSGWTA